MSLKESIIKMRNNLFVSSEKLNYTSGYMNKNESRQSSFERLITK